MAKRFRFCGILITLVALNITYAQEKLYLDRTECETIFLEENLSLVAEKLNIPKAEAGVKQAKLWPNPNFTLDEVNFWATHRQTGGAETSPPLWDGFTGRDQQFAISVEQLVQTAGKRKKLVALEKVTVEMSVQYFEDLLRNLKLEFRNLLTDLQYNQALLEAHESLLLSISELTTAYERQLDAGNISKSQYARLRLQEIEIQKDLYELRVEASQIQKELNVLMHLDPGTNLVLSKKGFEREIDDSRLLLVDELMKKAREERPDAKLSLLELDYSDKMHAYEKSQRVPDVTFSAGYDRNGSTMLDFVGFGISLDLPFFNRNQGNIKKAELEVEQSKIKAQQLSNQIGGEVQQALKDLGNALQLQNAVQNDQDLSLETLLPAYTKNLKNRNISLMEYLDFLDAYLENRATVFGASKDVNHKIEELNFSLGGELFVFD